MAQLAFFGGTKFVTEKAQKVIIIPPQNERMSHN